MLKTCMYDFRYDYMQPLYRDNRKIIYTDTDSLLYFLKFDDAYENLKRDIARFDTNNYPENNLYGISRGNKKIPGLMKAENNGLIMTEFVNLRAKIYATRGIGRSDTMKIKDIKKSIVAREITFDDYLRCLNDIMKQSRRQSCLRSRCTMYIPYPREARALSA